MWWDDYEFDEDDSDYEDDYVWSDSTWSETESEYSEAGLDALEEAIDTFETVLEEEGESVSESDNEPECSDAELEELTEEWDGESLDECNSEEDDESDRGAECSEEELDAFETAMEEEGENVSETETESEPEYSDVDLEELAEEWDEESREAHNSEEGGDSDSGYEYSDEELDAFEEEIKEKEQNELKESALERNENNVDEELEGLFEEENNEVNENEKLEEGSEIEGIESDSESQEKESVQDESEEAIFDQGDEQNSVKVVEKEAGESGGSLEKGVETDLENAEGKVQSNAVNENTEEYPVGEVPSKQGIENLEENSEKNVFRIISNIEKPLLDFDKSKLEEREALEASEEFKAEKQEAFEELEKCMNDLESYFPQKTEDHIKNRHTVSEQEEKYRIYGNNPKSVFYKVDGDSDIKEYIEYWNEKSTGVEDAEKKEHIDAKSMNYSDVLHMIQDSYVNDKIDFFDKEIKYNKERYCFKIENLEQDIGLEIRKREKDNTVVIASADSILFYIEKENRTLTVYPNASYVIKDKKEN